MADDPFDFQKSNRLDYESKLPGAKTEAQKRALWGEYRGNMKATNPDVDIPEYDKVQKAPSSTRSERNAATVASINEASEKAKQYTPSTASAAYAKGGMVKAGSPKVTAPCADTKTIKCY